MRQAPDSPRISRLSWGRIEVEGRLPFKDAKIFPGGAREWDWRETGTRHVPGIQPADIQELIEHGARTVVLSKKVWERLQVCPETLDVLSRNDIQVEVLQTEAAVERFNELRENIAVGGLFHSTCRAASGGCAGRSMRKADAYQASRGPLLAQSRHGQRANECPLLVPLTNLDLSVDGLVL
jgi:hypothetical protein